MTMRLIIRARENMNIVANRDGNRMTLFCDIRTREYNDIFIEWHDTVERWQYNYEFSYIIM